MVSAAVPVLYGNCYGGYSLHDPNRKIDDNDWAARIPDQVSLVQGSGCWVFLALEVHEETDPSFGAAGNGTKYFLNALRAVDLDWALMEGDGGNHCYYRPSKIAALSRVNKMFQVGRAYTDFTLRENATGFDFHVVLAHFFANDTNGRSRTKERRSQGLELAKYVRRLGYALVACDMNSSTEAEGYPRDSMEDAGFRGLRQRGSVVNGSLGTRPTAKNYTFWIDEIWTRLAQPVSGSALVETNGAADHNWLKTTITWDATVPPTPPPAYVPFAPPPPYSGNPWTASMRAPDFSLLDDVRFTSATLVENYDNPDMLSLTGTWDGLRPVMEPGFGLLLQDDFGNQRFSGHLVDIDKQGTKRATLIFAADTVRLWWPICWPKPTAPWTTAGQNVPYDIVTGSAEGRALYLIKRNLGPDALVERREDLLRVPTSQGRGPTGTTSARFENLGDLTSTLIEQANLRMRIRQTYVGSTPYLDLTLEESPDLSDWVQFSTPEEGGTYLLSTDWRYRVALPTVNVALSAAGGLGVDRILTLAEDADSQDLWKARVEQLVDQSGTTDPEEIANGLNDALAAGAGPSEIALPIGRAPGLGGVIPVGAKVAAVVDGDVIVERIRQVTTTLTKQTSEPTLSVTGTIGSPDGIQSPTQRRLAQALAAAKKGQRA